MFSALGGAPILIEEAPDIEFRRGMFYVCYKALDLCLALPPHAFFQAIARAAGESRKYKFGPGPCEVIDFAAHAASASGSPSK